MQRTGEPRCSPPSRRNGYSETRKTGRSKSVGKYVLTASDFMAPGGDLGRNGIPIYAENRVGRTWVRKPNPDEKGAFSVSDKPESAALSISVPRQRKRFAVCGEDPNGFSIRTGSTVVAHSLSADEASGICEVLREQGRKHTVFIP